MGSVDVYAPVEVVDGDAERRAAMDRVNAKLDQLRDAALPDPSEEEIVEDSDTCAAERLTTILIQRFGGNERLMRSRSP